MSNERSSAVIKTALDRAREALAAHEASLDQLRAQDESARRGGVECLRKHRRSMDDVGVERDVEIQRVGDLEQELEQALARETIVARDAEFVKLTAEALAMRERLKTEYPDLMRRTIELIEAEKDLWRRIKIHCNATGASPYSSEFHFEDVRGKPATPGVTRLEKVQVNRGPRVISADAARGPTLTSDEPKYVEREVSYQGAPAIVSKPLWESFNAPGLRWNDPEYKVA